MNKILLILTLLISLTSLAQSSDKYNSRYANFYRGEDLYLKEQYAAARKEFRVFIDELGNLTDPMYIKASYYEASAALELYNNDAVQLLLDFLKNYPESIYRTKIYFKLGKFYYYKRKFDDALVWFNKLDVQDVEEEDRDEYYFKLGYANFNEENYDEARSAFHEIKDGASQYANPALYYYSYIAYQNGAYQTALDGFLKLENDEKFGKITPYYIVQIYYLQGKYELVTDYASKIDRKDKLANEKDLDLIIGDSYYRTGQYEKAVPFLQRYNRSVNPTREESYRLGYALYRSGEYAKAIPELDRANKEEDSLGQAAYYHIAECMLKLDNKVSARSAFEGAAFIEADPIIAEDALYNFAVLSYKLDINPYDEAVEAFERYLNRYPNSSRKDDIYQYLVNVYLSTNNYDKALESIETIPNKDIRLKKAYQLVAFNQGVERFQNSQYSKAIQSFNLVDKYPVDPVVSARAKYWIADAHYRSDNFDKAITEYKNFLKLPTSMTPTLQSDARYNIGYAYLNKSYIYDKQDKLPLKHEMLAKVIEEFRTYALSNPPFEKKKADALLRVADAFFVLKDNEQAVKYYKQTYGLKAGFEDQALFYLAKTYGYMDGKTSEKIAALNDIINDYKDSKYMFAAIKEIADSYKSMEQYDKALLHYQKLIDDYPSSVLVVDAKISVADIYFKQGKFELSEQKYLAVLDQHSQNHKVCKRVADGLKDLYIATNHPEKIETLAEQYSCVEFSVSEQERLYYLPGVEIYSDSSRPEAVRYSEAIPKFEKYLEKFPTGRYVNEVKNYMADCHYSLGNIDQAVILYKQTLLGPNTAYTELAATRVAQYLYNNGEFGEVIQYYKRIETVSQTPEVVFNAKLGLMRSYFKTEDWKNAAIYADKVMANSSINQETRLIANYVKGMSNFYQEHYNDAEVSLEWVRTNTTKEMASEACYSLAEGEFKLGNLVEADELVADLLKMKPKYNYWVAKGLILRARILIQLDDLFSAEQNLKSIIDHYAIEDDGILDEANQLYNELMQLKNQQREIEEETGPEIEINDN